jgi:hypothetical protein
MGPWQPLIEMLWDPVVPLRLCDERWQCRKCTALRAWAITTATAITTMRGGT